MSEKSQGEKRKNSEVLGRGNSKSKDEVEGIGMVRCV